MRTTILAILFCITSLCAQAQAQWAIQICKSTDQSGARGAFSAMRTDITSDPLLKELYASYLYLGTRVSRDEHFVYYFNPARQTETEVATDLAGLKHFVHAEAVKFPITDLKTVKVRTTAAVEARTPDGGTPPTRTPPTQTPPTR